MLTSSIPGIDAAPDALIGLLSSRLPDATTAELRCCVLATLAALDDSLTAQHAANHPQGVAEVTTLGGALLWTALETEDADTYLNVNLEDLAAQVLLPEGEVSPDLYRALDYLAAIPLDTLSGAQEYRVLQELKLEVTASLFQIGSGLPCPFQALLQTVPADPE